MVFDGEGRFVSAVLRPAKRPSGREVRAFLRRLLRQLRANWPRVEVVLRADSHCCAPEALRWCRANKVGYLLGVAPTSTLRRHVERLEASTAARFVASGACAKLRRFTEFHDGISQAVGVDGPRRHRVCQNEVGVDLKQRRPSVDQISRIGTDTSKHVFQLHGVNAAEAPVLRKKLRRKEMAAFFEKLAPTVIAVEACGASHHWARLLQSFGHTVKLISPQLVKPCVKRGKNDAADAEALCEAIAGRRCASCR